MKKATVIIPTKNKLSRLSLVLKSLEPQVNQFIEVVIIFDGCKADILKAYERLKFTYTPEIIINKKSMGRAGARNRGIMKARGEIIIFLDDDRIPCPGYIEKHLELHQNRRVAILGKRYNVEYTEKTLARMFIQDTGPEMFKQLAKDAVKEKNDWLKMVLKKILGKTIDSLTFTTGNSSVRRSDLLDIGMFDENFTGWGVEDVDLGYRLIKSGVKVHRDSNPLNYHLVHPVNLTNQKAEYRQNFNYFAEKIKHDKVSILLALLINRFSIYH